MNNTSINQSDLISIGDVFTKIKNWFKYLINKWWVILITAILGASIGFVYSIIKPTTYTAKLSFLVEEGKSGGGGIASLAGQFGFDIAGLGGSNSLLSGDNIPVFLKSISLARHTLLTPYDTQGKISLADRYAEVNGLRKKWLKHKKIGKEIFFPVNNKKPYNRLQDSLLQVIINRILKEEFFIERPDKKASFVQVSAEMKDELLAKFYCERLVKAAIDKYVDSKINRQAINVNRLQKRADSIGYLLNRKTYATAVAQENILDVNPGFKTATVSAEVTGRDKIMLTTIYGEVIKNLEISKVALSQETPTIQIIDEAMLPLKVNEADKLTSILLGTFLAIIICISVLTITIFLKNRM